MAIAPTHYIWQRERSVYHSGAIRNYNKDEAQLPRGPNNSPIPCYLCGKKGRFVRLGLSSSSSSSTGSLEVTELCSSQDLKGTFAIEKMLVDSPASSAQDCQSLSSKRRRDNTSNQDKSMDWFTSNEEWNALNKETDAVLCRTICVALQGHRWLLKHFPLNSK